jgi:hypothetical protein
MAPRVSPDLENALAESPAARERFWALPPDRKDAWVAYVERGRFGAARRRRAADAVRRLGAPAPTVQEGAAAPVALPRTDWTEWVIGLALLLGLAAFLLWLTVFRHHHKDAKPTPKRAAAASTVPRALPPDRKDAWVAYVWRGGALLHGGCAETANRVGCAPPPRGGEPPALNPTSKTLSRRAPPRASGS